MKFINFQTFAELAELSVRANGKTQESVRYALNVLFNGTNRHVLYIGYSQHSCTYARQVAVEMVKSHPEYGIEITVNSRYYMEFISGAGRSVLVLSPFSTSIHACRGRTLDEIIFDVDLETLFKDNQKEDGKFRELLYSVGPCMVHRPKIDADSLNLFF